MRSFPICQEDLVIFADSNSIPENQPTNFHPSLIVAILLKFFLFTLRAALSAIPTVSER